MSDFHQNGVITDFHNLTRRPVEALEQELSQFANRRPMGLILPSLFSELEGPALSAIVDELVKVPYLNEIVIGLDRADREQFLYAREFFLPFASAHAHFMERRPTFARTRCRAGEPRPRRTRARQRTQRVVLRGVRIGLRPFIGGRPTRLRYSHL